MNTQDIKPEIKRKDLVFPELSYRIIGILYDVYNELGYGFDEKTYQKAVAIAFKKNKIKFDEQVYAPVEYEGQRVASNYFDFLVEGKIVVEIKKGDRFAKSHIDQVYKYLKSGNLKLGILIYFAPRKLHYKRILNIQD